MLEVKASEVTSRKIDATAVRVIDAAAQCVETLGFDKTSIEDIVKASGVSRATLFRRFGNREGIFIALLLQQAKPIVAGSHKAIAAESSLAKRIVVGMVYAVDEMSRNKLIKALLEKGTASSSLNLIRPVFIELVSATLLRTLEDARDTGELHTKIAFSEILEWLLRDFILLVSEGPWDEERLQQHAENFILPVLEAKPFNDASLDVEQAHREHDMAQRMQRMEANLASMNSTLELLRERLLNE